jgi:transposase
MPKIKRRQYDDAYKREAVELILSGDRSTAKVARSLDLNAHVLRRSKKQYENNELSVEARAKQDETAALRRALSRGRMERDILKKPWAFSPR